MTRLSFLSATLALAGCSDDLAAPPTAGPASPEVSVRDPRVGSRPDAIEPTSCVAYGRTAVSFGTAGYDELRDVAITPRGTILVAGYEHGTAAHDDRVVGARGTVLEYSNDLATVERRANLDTNGSDSFESIAIAPDSQRVWLAARTNGDVPGLDSRGGDDFVVGELANGFRPLARGFESTAEQPRRIAVDERGFVAIAGVAERTQPDDTVTIDPFLTVFDGSDAGASPLWHTTRHHPHHEHYLGLDVGPAAVVAGGGITDGEEQGMFVIARDRDAGILWQRRLSELGTDRVTAVKILPDGDVLWAGTSASQLGETHHGGTDVVVGRLAGTTGAILWTAQYGSASDERAHDLAVDAEGRIYIAGDVLADDKDVMLLVLEGDGRPLREEYWTGTYDDVPAALAVDPCGTAVIVGYTKGDLVGTPQGLRDGFVLVSHAARDDEFH